MLLQMRSDPDVATNIGCAVSWDFCILRHGYLLGMNLPVTSIFASLVGISILYKPLFATFTELGVDPIYNVCFEAWLCVVAS